jgi:peptidoglycan/xylan/chitin deacetylase (PgdA/CDA1 family)
MVLEMMKAVCFLFFLISFFFTSIPLSPAKTEEKNSPLPSQSVPIYLYHRFGHEITDSMTVSVVRFESQLKHFREQNATIIPLRQLVNFLLKKGPSLPSRSVVLTVDDGHKSVYTEMFPLVKKYRAPVTVFLYPSAISNASYAATWPQLREMKETGLFDYQSHTFWHPNFKIEKRRLKPDEYESFVEGQLKKPKARLEKEFSTKIDMLAWPFGIYDEELLRKAREAGYIAAFGMERRDVNGSENIMALPRYLIADPMRKVRNGSGRLSDT